MIKKTQINESRADKLALNYLKSKGVTDYNKQMEIIGSLKHDIPNLRNGKGKFVLGALRCYFDRQLTDYQTINAFDKALGYIFKGNHQDEYDENLNGASVEELTNKYKDLIKSDLQTDVERSNNRQFQGGSNYKIIPINSFEEARQYANYTSWCVTQGEDAFKQYTNGGAKRFYFCLKNGFENVAKTVGENTPLDEYGLSMISVLINNLDGGSVDRVTTRWNHDHNGENNPGLSTAEQLENVLNVPFYRVFKPYTRDEFHQMGVVLFDEVQGLLDSGKNPEEIFDWVGDFDEGFAWVGLNGKYNWINTKRRLVSPNQWYDSGGDFHEGFVKVGLNDKGMNWVNTEGQLINQNQWYDEVYDFHKGFARVYRKGKGFNWVNTDGQLIDQNRWYDKIGDFHEGFARVKRIGKGWNWVNTEGRLIDPNQWYDSAFDFNRGFARVKRDGKGWNWVNTEGQLVSPNQWYDEVRDFHEGFARVRLYDKGYNWVNTKGRLIDQDQWYHVASDFHDGLARVKHNGKGWNWINTERRLLSPNQWYDWVDDFHDGLAQVDLDADAYYVDKNGVLYGYRTRQPLPDDQQPNKKQENTMIKETKEKDNAVIEKLRKNIIAARKEVNRNPSEGQKHAGNYKMGHVVVNGYDISLENPKGSYRRGIDPDGKKWSCRMYHDYGYFRSTLGRDGDAVDVFIGDDYDSKRIFVIDQILKGKFDESKVMFCFKNEKEAMKGYLANYEKGWSAGKYITEVSDEIFREWLYDGYKQRKPFHEYVKIKKNKLNEAHVGSKIPKTCPVCGSKVGLYIKGEPVYLCSNKKCGKYFGTLPFHKHKNDVNESVLDIARAVINESQKRKQYVNMNVELRKGGRNAVKMSVKDFEDELMAAYKKFIMDNDLGYSYTSHVSSGGCGNTLGYNNKQFAKYAPLKDLYKDIWQGKYKFDTENVESEGGIKVTSSGVPYLSMYAGGDWECPVRYFIYFDGSKLRGYVPLKGNAICRTTNQAFGDHDSSDDNEEIKFLKKEFGVKDKEDLPIQPDNVDYNPTACLEDFTARLDVKDTYKKRDFSKLNAEFEEYKAKKTQEKKEKDAARERENEQNNSVNMKPPKQLTENQLFNIVNKATMRLLKEDLDNIDDKRRRVLTVMSNHFSMEKLKYCLEALGLDPNSRILFDITTWINNPQAWSLFTDEEIDGFARALTELGVDY